MSYSWSKFTQNASENKMTYVTWYNLSYSGNVCKEQYDSASVYLWKNIRIIIQSFHTTKYVYTV